MPINPQIPLQVQNLDTANPLLNFMKVRAAKTETDMNEAKLGEYRNNQELKSLAIGAHQVLPFLESGDTQGALAMLKRRQQGLIDTGRDDSHTKQAIAVLESGDPQKIKEMAALAKEDIRLASQLGLFQGKDIPSAVRTYQYYESLKTPEEKRNFLTTLRAERVMDAGDRIITVNPQTRQSEDVTPKGLPPQDQPDVKRLQAQATEQGKNTAEAANNLSAITDAANTELANIQKLRTAPGMSDVIGAKNVASGAVTSYIPFYPTDQYGDAKAIPGTQAADFQSMLNQVRGGSFLQAYNTLKGGGQITEVEGQKATEAVARMQTAQTEESFKKALDDYEAIIKLGIERARKKAGVSVSTKQPATTGGIKFLGFEN